MGTPGPLTDLSWGARSYIQTPAMSISGRTSPKTSGPPSCRWVMETSATFSYNSVPSSLRADIAEGLLQFICTDTL